MPKASADGPSDEVVAQLTARLPAAARARVLSLKLADDIVTLILDGGDLDQIGRDRLETSAQAALLAAPGISPRIRDVRVGMTADKPATAAQSSNRGPRIIAIGSGKGGVGKSTLSANLAVALARMGRRVGLVDADIYGPSQSRLLATEGIRPEARDSRMFPVPSPWGIGMLSMGQLIEPGKAIAWRGPMVGKALAQLIEAHWGETELLVVDLPPGTGDIQLTMLQRFRPAGAVIVSTPQDLALMDATRALQLFETAGVPVIGLVENMAGYACPHCGEMSDPFGTGGVEAAAAALGHAFLGRVPLDLAIRQDSDAGRPPAAGEGPQGQAFAANAMRLNIWLDRPA